MNKNILWIVLGVSLLLGITWVGSTYNTLVGLDEKVIANWAQVENQYKRRLDLIPNLVETVKGYASHEKNAGSSYRIAFCSTNSCQGAGFADE